MSNLAFQIICLLLIWCGSFAPFKLDTFLFLCLLFFIYLSVTLWFLATTRHYSPCHLLQTHDKCWLLVPAHHCLFGTILFSIFFSNTNSMFELLSELPISSSSWLLQHLLVALRVYINIYAMLSLIAQIQLFFFFFTLSSANIINCVCLNLNFVCNSTLYKIICWIKVFIIMQSGNSKVPLNTKAAIQRCSLKSLKNTSK